MGKRGRRARGKRLDFMQHLLFSRSEREDKRIMRVDRARVGETVG
jgi:hypothetical protein